MKFVFKKLKISSRISMFTGSAQ